MLPKFIYLTGSAPDLTVGLWADPGFIPLTSHQQKDPQCSPFWQQLANMLQSHPKQLWGAAELGFCKQKRDITVPLALTNNNHTIQSFDNTYITSQLR